MANRRFTQFFNTLHTKPVLIDCNFVVDSTNGNGLGIRNLKGPGVQAVYMHTSATPAINNPNPASGVILLELQDCYNRYYGGFSGQVSALGSSVTATTANVAYVITSLGTATVAQWNAVGLPVGTVPAIGAAFIATSSATIGGSATVAPSATAGSGIDHIEVLGDPNQTIQSQAPIFPQGISGAYIILQCFSGGAITAPANNSVINLTTYLSSSSIMVQGE